MPIRFLAGLAILAFAAALALWRGGWPERAVAAILVGTVVIDQTFHALFPNAETYTRVDVWHLAVDLAMLALFLVVAVAAERIWTLWVCSLQLLSVLGHFVRLVDHEMNQFVYAIFLRGPFWLMLALLLWGSLHQARLRRKPTESASPGNRHEYEWGSKA